MRQRNAHAPLSAWAKSLARPRRKLSDLGMRLVPSPDVLEFGVT